MNQSPVLNDMTTSIDAIKYIVELEGLNLKAISFDDLQKLVLNYFPVLPIPASEIPVGEKIYRARLNIENNNKAFTLAERITAPKSEYVKEFGRANKINEPIFYASSNYLMAAFEVMQYYKTNDFINDKILFLTVGEWEVKQKLNIAQIVHSDKTHSIRKDIQENYLKRKAILDHGILTGEFKQDVVDAATLICDFFANQFTKENVNSHHDYKLSACYVERIKNIREYQSITEENKLDGVNYPSVAIKYKGDNQAIFIESVEAKLKLVNAYQLVCFYVNYSEFGCTSKILHEAESIENGIITWKTEMYKGQFRLFAGLPSTCKKQPHI